MKYLKTTYLILLAFIIGFFSCETENTSSLKKQVEMNDLSNYIVGDSHVRKNSSKNSLKNSGNECVNDFELWYYDQGFFGIVTVYPEGEELVIEYKVDDLLTTCGIEETWLIVSPDKDWEEVNGQPDWFGDEDIMRDDTHGGAKIVIIRIPLEEWMIKDCFYIATKVRLSCGSNEVWPRAFIEKDKPIWEDPFCLCLPGTGTQGYWKNHDWPVEEITIGGVDYEEDVAQDLMKHPTAGDKTYNMFEQLVAAKLNILIGNDDSCINEHGTEEGANDYIDEADNWMSMHMVGSGVPAESEYWQDLLYGNHHSASDIHYMLDEYNNGHLCAESRD